MNRTSALLSFLLVSVFAYSQDDLQEIKDWGENPGNLNMYMHMPAGKHDSSGSRPLIVVLHGCTQGVTGLSKQSGWNMLADRYGFYVLYPQQKLSNNMSKCFNWFRKRDVLKDKGEVGSIKYMIDYAIEKYPVDKTKIFVYGVSAGAAMGVALMADYPQLINAGAILAGGPFIPDDGYFKKIGSMLSPKDQDAKELASPVYEQNPGYAGKYPRVIVVHGKSDNVVDIKNAYLIIKQWTYIHHTDDKPDSVINTFQQNADISKQLFYDSTGTAAVIYYEAEHLGHAIMVDPGDKPGQGGETGLYAKDKDFFSTYWIALDFGIINNEHLIK